MGQRGHPCPRAGHLGQIEIHEGHARIAARIHQHLRIGDGDVDFTELFTTLKEIGYLDHPDALIVSNVFAEDERADEVSKFQLEKIRELVASS